VRILAACIALTLPAASRAQNCNSLYAAVIAENAGVADCQTVVATPRCPAGTTADQCADATWSTPPPPAGGNGPYRARFVYGLDVRCVDGTRPLIYVDKAVDAQGNDLYSNDWLFMTGGEGGPCAGSAARLGCYEKYVGNTTPEFKEALSSMHPDRPRPRLKRKYGGILDPRPVVNPANANPFAAFNRVYLERCTTGVSRGLEDVALEWTDSLGIVTSSSLTATTARVYHHGDLLWQAIFDQTGTAAGRDLGGGGNAYVNGPDLPPLADATTVLFGAHSDAGKWLIYSGDRLAARIQALNPKVKVNVGLALDAHAVPSLQHEMQRNEPLIWANMFLAPHENIPGHPLPDDGDLDNDEGFGNDIWLPAPPGNGAYQLADGMSAVVDASCEAYHGAMSHECLDEMHVAFNHLSTPVFFRQDQRDNVFIGKPAQFGFQGPPDYAFRAVEFQPRVFDQFVDYVNNYDVDAHLVSGNPMGIFSPNRGGNSSHTGFVSRRKSIREKIRLCENGVALQRLNLARVLYEWLVNGIERTVIEGATDADIPGQLLPLQSWVRSGPCP
jgi:hypothetical protein